MPRQMTLGRIGISSVVVSGLGFGGVIFLASMSCPVV